MAAGGPFYINSGGILFRPSQKMHDDILAILSNAKYRPLARDPGEQDVIFEYIRTHYGDFEPLPGYLNVRTHVKNPQESADTWANAGTAILHYTHHPKPWLALFGDTEHFNYTQPHFIRNLDADIRLRLSQFDKDWSLNAWT